MKSQKPHPHWPSPPLSRLRNWQLARLPRHLSETVLPFSAHYPALFEREKLTPADLRTFDDLRYIPFTSKADFQSDAAGANAVKDFVLVPDQHILKRRPSTIVRALLHGKASVEAAFEHEFRPL